MRARRAICLSAFAASIVSIALPSYANVKEWWNEQFKQSRSAVRLDAETAAAGLREALEAGTRRAVLELGRENGFWRHPSLRIPVPERLRKLDRGLRRLGQDKIADDFALSLNQAAERATPIARDIFVEAARQMTIHDALGVLAGPPDAATRYFRRHAEAPLVAAFRPVVQRSTASVGVTARYKRFVRSAESLGMADMQGLDIDDYVTRKALDAVFNLVAAEEQRIRTDPVARTTQLLRRVFQ